jgi:hypothetical protein
MSNHCAKNASTPTYSKTRRRRAPLALMLPILLLSASLAGRAEQIWLSSLDLSKASQGWGTPSADRSVENHPLTLGGQKYEHGFGTHSVGVLLINLKGGSTKFHAVVGVDDETAGRGSVEFQVRADGKQVWSSGVLKGGQPGKTVDLDVTGVKTLALDVGDAGDGFDYDHADWADAYFEVTGAKPETFTRPSTDPVIAMQAPADGTTTTITAANQPSTPPMGWNSYDGYGDSVTEAEFLANARAVAQQLKPHGWQYVVVDYCWYDPTAYNNQPNEHAGEKLPMDEFGRLLPAVNRFPSAEGGKGFKPLADQVHAMGLKFGIHLMRGIARGAVEANLPIEGSDFKAQDAGNTRDRCAWCPFMYGVRGETPAGQAWYDSIFRQYAAWGVDLVKVDDLTSPYHAAEVAAIHLAIGKCGRPMLFSTSPGPTPVGQAAHISTNANMWRATGDLWDNWPQLQAAFGVADRWSGHGTAGHWPDLDMLPFGHLSVKHRSVGEDRQTKFSKAEQVTMMTLWCLAPSPLMLGGNVADADAWELALLTNDEVLAVNQDTATLQAKRVSNKDGLEIWTRPLAGGATALAFFNRTDDDATMRANLVELGLTGGYKARDLWQRKDFSIADGGVEMFVPAHGATMLRLRKSD